MDPADLERTLAMVMAPRSEDIKAASERLKTHYYEIPDTVFALVQILQRHQEMQMRQLAGVEVRKLIPRFWCDSPKPLPDEVIKEIRSSLLQSTLQEQNELVRHTSARVISAIAREDLDENRWAELLPALYEAASTSKDPRQREVAVYILYALLDTDYSSAVSDNAVQLLQLLSQTIKDTDRTVRVSSVLALCCLGDSLDGEAAKQFPQLIPSVVEVLGEAVQSDDEKNALQLFERIGELIMGDPVLLGDTFGELISHMITRYASATDMDIEYRLAALRVINGACLFRYTRIKSLRYGPELIKALVQIIVTDEDIDEDDDDDESDETTVTRLALRSIGVLAMYLPPKQSIHPLLDLLPGLVHSGDPKQLRAGYLAFSVSVSGAPDFVASETDTIVPWIMSGFSNPSKPVQVAALQALCMMAMDLPNQVREHHAKLLPLVFGIMDQAQTVHVARTACRALDSVLSTLSSEVITDQYLSVIVPKLLDLVDKAPDTQLKGSVVNAIGSAAIAAGRSFIPYFARSVETIQKFIILPPPTDNLPVVKLSGETLETLGTFCIAVGAEQFAPYLPACLEAALTFLTGEESQLKDIGPIFIGNAAAVFGDHLASYLPRIMPALFSIFQQQEFIGFPEDDDEDDAGDVAIGGDEDDDEGLRVNSAVAMEKEFACDCLGELWSHCSAATMAPYTKETLEKLGDLGVHFYEDVRRSAVITAWHLATTLNNAEAIEAVWSFTTELFESEDDLAVVQQVFESISTAIGKIGRPALGTDENLQTLLSTLFEVGNGTHRSMLDFEDEADKSTQSGEGKDDMGEVTESVQALIVAAFDLFIDIARSLQTKFLPVFPQVAATIKPYTTSKSEAERSTGVYAFAELLSILGSGISEFSNDLLHVFGNGLVDPVAEVRSMAAYGMGFLCQTAPDECVLPAYPQILMKLQEGLLASTDKIDDRSTANACGCVARMALAHFDSVPIDQVVTALLSKMPLNDGLEEYPPILAFFARLAELGHSSLGGSNAEHMYNFLQKLQKDQSEAAEYNASKSITEESKATPLSDAGDLENVLKTLQALGHK